MGEKGTRIAARFYLAAVALLLPSVCGAADKEVVRLQRDVALLSEDVRMLQRSLHERMGAIMALLHQTLDRVNQAHTANVVAQKTIADRLAGQGLPVAELGAKLDQIAADSVAIRAAVADVNARLVGLEQKFDELENAVRIIQAPLPPPPAEEAPSSDAAIRRQPQFPGSRAATRAPHILGGK